MKKLVLATVCAMAVSSVAFAQGYVNWNSIGFAYMTAQTNSATYFGGTSATGGAVGLTSGAASLGTGFYYELLYTSFSGTQAAKPTTLASLATWSDAGLSASNSTTAGRLSAMRPTTGAAVPWANGTTNSVMLVGWSANLGSSWSTVLASLQNNSYVATLAGANAFLGVSSTGYINPALGTTGVSVFGSAAAAQGLPIYSLNTQLYLVPVPEPATMALFGLGGLSLLMFRRRS